VPLVRGVSIEIVVEDAAVAQAQDAQAGSEALLWMRTLLQDEVADALTISASSAPTR
jgi:hypothetical protein